MTSDIERQFTSRSFAFFDENGKLVKGPSTSQLLACDITEIGSRVGNFARETAPIWISVIALHLGAKAAGAQGPIPFPSEETKKELSDFLSLGCGLSTGLAILGFLAFQTIKHSPHSLLKPDEPLKFQNLNSLGELEHLVACVQHGAEPIYEIWDKIDDDIVGGFQIMDEWAHISYIEDSIAKFRADKRVPEKDKGNFAAFAKWHENKYFGSATQNQMLDQHENWLKFLHTSRHKNRRNVNK